MRNSFIFPLTLLLALLVSPLFVSADDNNMDTNHGQSGSAVLNNSNEIVAIHSSGFMFGDHSLENGGPKTTSSVVNFIKNNGN